MNATPVADLGLGHVRLEAAAAGLPSAGTEYGPPAGSPALREAVASWERVPIEEVALSTGASLGLVATLATLPRPCSILCPRPHYPAYPPLAAAMGLDVIYYGLTEELAWNPRVETIAERLRDDTRAILWNFPGNPTGSLPSPATLAGMEELVRRSDLLVISDEVYADFVYDDHRFPDMRVLFGGAPVVRLRSFSKLFGIPGERLGYVVADPQRLQAICRAHWAFAMSPPAHAQTLALALLRSEPERRLRGLRRALAANRDHAVRLLAGCDRVRFAVPPAGIFCWLEVLDCPLESRALARACANRAGVVVVPGAAFGVDDPTYLRVSFAAPWDELTRGLESLVRFLREL